MASNAKYFGLSFFVLIGLAAYLAILPALSQVSVQAVEFDFQQPETVVDDIPYLEMSNHSDPAHVPSNSAVAAQIIERTYQEWQVAPGNGGFDPQKLLCKAVEMANGMTYYAIWMADAINPAIGSVSVYSMERGWITSFEGKARLHFEEGTPRGSVSWKLINCNDLHPPGLTFSH